MSPALPEYRVRRSTRARRVRLTVTARDGLVVTLPAGVPERVAAEAVAARSEWASAKLAGVAEYRAELLAAPDALVPAHVEVTAFDELWPVEYRHTAAPHVRVAERGALLVATGAVDDAEACLAGLRRWRDRMARERLVAEIVRLADPVGTLVSSVSVRGQRTRWGSCSSAGAISLNRNLVFLPERLMHHVILHELAHLTYRDHSDRFRTLLEAYDPDAQVHRSELKEAWRHVPAWASE